MFVKISQLCILLGLYRFTLLDLHGIIAYKIFCPVPNIFFNKHSFELDF